MTDESATGSADPTLGDGPSSGPGSVEPDLVRGAVVDRYVIIDRVGAGGMGVVYVAYDPELDRKVALKVLRPRADEGRAKEARTRVLREAQALAKLSHPAVVTVHDVGTLGTRVWLAMELVVGRTLGAWWKQERRRWSEQVETLVRAAEGLAAAHAAGLVHRDFKPDNVMVDEDGRVRVMDFGLARAAAPDRTSQRDPSASTSGALLDLELTQEGALLGTPAYMSPEQLLGRTVDERTDQFSFCVTMWEGLFRERPFGGHTLAEHVSAVVAGEPRAPADPGAAPRWLRRVLLRGLAREPERRFPTMRALVEELERGRARARVRRGVAVVAGVAIAAGGVGVARALVRADRGRRCDDEGQRIATVWPGRAEAVHAGLVATGVDHAADTASRVAARLDGYAAAWADARARTCRRFELDDAIGRELHDRAVACLDGRFAQLESFTELLAGTDAAGVHRATSAALELPRIEPCLDEAALLRMSTGELAPGESGAEVRRALARVSALLVLGEYATARAEAKLLVATAESLGHAPTLARARVLLGTASELAADYEAASTELEQAFVLAGGAGDDAIAAEAATKLIGTSQRRLRLDEGLHWGRLAEMSLHRLGAAEEGVLDGKLLAALGSLHRSRGDFEQAIVNDQRALALLERVVGAEHPDVADVLNKLGVAFEHAGRWDEAEAPLTRALALREQTLGPTHPGVAATLTNLGSLRLDAGDVDRALAEYRRALAILEAAHGPDHPDVAMALHNLAEALRKSKDLVGALASLERALAIYEKALGHDHPESADVLLVMGQIHAQQGDTTAALAHYGRALAILERDPELHRLALARLAVSMGNLHANREEFREALPFYERASGLSAELWGPDHPLRAVILHNLGAVRSGLHEYTTALGHLQGAVAIRERALGPDHVELASSLLELGTVLVALDRATEALPVLERSFAMKARTDLPADDAAALHFVLARALWETGGDRTRAIELARTAAASYRGLGAEGAKGLAAVETWLARHRRP